MKLPVLFMLGSLALLALIHHSALAQVPVSSTNEGTLNSTAPISSSEPRPPSNESVPAPVSGSSNDTYTPSGNNTNAPVSSYPGSNGTIYSPSSGSNDTYTPSGNDTNAPVSPFGNDTYAPTSGNDTYAPSPSNSSGTDYDWRRFFKPEPNADAVVFGGSLFFSGSGYNSSYSIRTVFQNVFSGADLVLQVTRIQMIRRFTQRVFVRVSTSPDPTDVYSSLSDSFIEFSPNNAEYTVKTRVLITGCSSGTRYLHIARAVNDSSVNFSLDFGFTLAIPMRESSPANSTTDAFDPVHVNSVMPAYTYDRFVFYFPSLLNNAANASYSWWSLPIFVPLRAGIRAPLSFRVFSDLDARNTFEGFYQSETSQYRCMESRLYAPSAIVTVMTVHRGTDAYPDYPITYSFPYSFSLQKSDGSDACAYCDLRNV